MIYAVILLFTIGGAFSEVIQGKTAIYLPVDYTGATYTGHTCALAAGKCGKTEIASKLVPIAHSCVALCRNDYKDTCASAYWDATTRHCHILNDRCTTAELTDVYSGSLYFRRRRSDETTCPDCLSLYASPPRIYADSYCCITGKSCPGVNMYMDKPWKNFPRKFCADKMNRIVTGGMFDWVPNAGQDANLESALGTCYFKANKCSDAQLVNSANPKARNCLRLLKTDPGCPANRQGYCSKGKLHSCRWIDHSLRIWEGYVDNEQACKQRCDMEPLCKVIAYGTHKYCELHKGPWCDKNRINAGDRFEAFVKKDNHDQDCSELPHFGA